MPRKRRKPKFRNPMLDMIKQTVADQAPAAHVRMRTKVESDADRALRAQRIIQENKRKQRLADERAMAERRRQEKIAQRAAILQKHALEQYNKDQARLAVRRHHALEEIVLWPDEFMFSVAA